jgi:hypothetical protein
MVDPSTRGTAQVLLPCHLLTTQAKTPQHYIIAFGNGSCPNLRGNLPAPSKRFLDHLKSLSRRNVQVSTVIIDEYLYLTSVCGMPQKNLGEST